MANLPAGKTFTATVTYTKSGDPGQVDGMPVWALSPPELGTVTPSEDGLSATVLHLAPGTGTLTVTADADLGEADLPLIATAEIVFEEPVVDTIGADAAAISFSEPV